MHLYNEYARTKRRIWFWVCVLSTKTCQFLFWFQPICTLASGIPWKSLKVKDTHLEMYHDFNQGRFTLKRIRKGFSTSPIDFTLDQTINVDSASQKTGIRSSTNSMCQCGYVKDRHKAILYEQKYLLRIWETRNVKERRYSPGFKT